MNDENRTQLFHVVSKDVQDGHKWWRLGEQLGLTVQETNSAIFHALLLSATMLYVDGGNNRDDWVEQCGSMFDSVIWSDHKLKMMTN